jgi:hypothetical protein
VRDFGRQTLLAGQVFSEPSTSGRVAGDMNWVEQLQGPELIDEPFCSEVDGPRSASTTWTVDERPTP